jgi:flagellar protein FliS
MGNGYGAYRDTNVATADQGKLILICYDVAITHGQQALECFGDAQRIEERTRHLKKVQDAISELMGGLRMDVGEIAHNLYRMYEYMLRQLTFANLRQEPKYVTEILGYLTDLRDAWGEAVQKTKAEAAAQQNLETNKSFAITG